MLGKNGGKMKSEKLTPGELGEMSARQENYDRSETARDLLVDRIMKLKVVRDDILDNINYASKLIKEIDRELGTSFHNRASAYWIPFFKTALNGGNAIMTDFNDTLEELQEELRGLTE